MSCSLDGVFGKRRGVLERYGARGYIEKGCVGIRWDMLAEEGCVCKKERIVVRKDSKEACW